MGGHLLVRGCRPLGPSVRATTCLPPRGLPLPPAYRAFACLRTRRSRRVRGSRRPDQRDACDDAARKRQRTYLTLRVVTSTYTFLPAAPQYDTAFFFFINQHLHTVLVSVCLLYSRVYGYFLYLVWPCAYRCYTTAFVYTLPPLAPLTCYAGTLLLLPYGEHAHNTYTPETPTAVASARAANDWDDIAFTFWGLAWNRRDGGGIASAASHYLLLYNRCWL